MSQKIRVFLQVYEQMIAIVADSQQMNVSDISSEKRLSELEKMDLLDLADITHRASKEFGFSWDRDEWNEENARAYIALDPMFYEFVSLVWEKVKIARASKNQVA